MPFVRLHAQAMDPEIMMKHIQLYVNDYSVSLGKEGREAIVNLIQQQTGKNRQIQPENKWFIE
jgi:1,4-dihydroxy-6-naphthoate synthase